MSTLASASPVLVVNGLTAGYGKIPILDGIDFAAAGGEVVGIVGYNGMGKTTLMKAMIGLLAVSSGTIVFDSLDVTGMPPFSRARLGIGYVPQCRDVFPRLTVRENLRMGALGVGSARKEILDEIVDEFPRLERLLDRAAGTLSGGEQQILAIARALCTQPKLLLLDEPTEGVQPSIVEHIGEVLSRWVKTSRLAIILVEQNLEFVSGLASRALILNKGRIVNEVLPEKLHSAMELDEIIEVGDLSGRRAT